MKTQFTNHTCVSESELNELIGTELARSTEVCRNVDRKILLIDRNKLELCLRKHIPIIAEKKDWKPAAKFFFSVILALCSGSFHDTFGIDASLLRAFFIVLAFIEGLTLIKVILRTLRPTSSVEILLEDIEHRGQSRS